MISKTQIQIHNTTDDMQLVEDELLPSCPSLVYDYLLQRFNLDTLMIHISKNNDEHMGYIKGVMDVLSCVKVLANLNNKE